MATRTLDFFQVYFRPEQVNNLYPFAIPHYNEKITDFFENSIISELVPNSQADLISVCSHRLKEKRTDCIRVSTKPLTEEIICNTDFDVAVLTPRSPTHKALFMASIWHNAWASAFKELQKFIKCPDEVKVAIYENHFIATREIYQEYVNTVLKPCIEFMKDKPAFFSDANYAKRKKPEEVIWYREKTGRNDWPIAPFILERLFSIWINDKQFKVISL